ncbi:MAG: endonuclease/exonuclease/phosphatase family protein [Bacteroidota bacterium]
MKKTSLFDRVVFVFNLFFSFLLAFSFLTPHLSARYFCFFAFLGLAIPILVVANFTFFVYWLFRRKKQLFLPLLFLVAAYFLLDPFYKFSSASNEDDREGLTIMSFNTRNFNIHGQLDVADVDSLIIDFLNSEDPDIICLQECHYSMKRSNALQDYNYKYVDYVYGEYSGRVIQAIFSKYPILSKQVIEFPESSNAAIYSDILVHGDTIRLYNFHLQSFRVIPEIETLKNENSRKLVGRINQAIKKQQRQSEILKDHIVAGKIPSLVVGDMNNTQFSNIYRNIKGGLQDTYLEKGKGFGKTYSLFRLPMRIDYIFADPSFEVLSHKNYEVQFSDHYPIMATLRLK